MPPRTAGPGPAGDARALRPTGREAVNVSLAMLIVGLLAWVAGAARWWIELGPAYGIAWFLALPGLAAIPALRRGLAARRRR